LDLVVEERRKDCGGCSSENHDSPKLLHWEAELWAGDEHIKVIDEANLLRQTLSCVQLAIFRAVDAV
jgi:hypothetical protein